MEARLKLSRHKVRKIPNSPHICVFGWFELSLRVVLIWKLFDDKGKNMTFMSKLDALRFSSLCLSEGLAPLREPETQICLVFASPWRRLLRLGET